jgi:hypothetical protein
MSHRNDLGSLAVAALLSVAAVASTIHAGSGPDQPPVIYVITQGLYYDAVVGPDLPPQGPFQQLVPGGPSGLMTRYGPGDEEYAGGRWWLDANANGIEDAPDAYFSCPLLPPGRERP